MVRIDIKGCVIIFMVVVLLLLGLGVLLVRAESPSGEAIHVQRENQGGSVSLFSMEFRDADLKDILRALGQQNQLNIIMGDEVQGKVTLSFQKVRLFDALEAILRIHNLTYFQEGNIIRIVRSPFSEGEGDLLTKTLSINYARAKETSDSLKGLLSTKGSISFDERTNTLIVRDVPENVRRMTNLVKELDSKTPQVLIEARIVEATTSFSRELGIQWGGSFQSTGGSGTSTVYGGAIRSRSDDPFATALTGALGLSGAPFAVNLPAAVGRGAGGALGYTFANLSNSRMLDVQLSALEDSGKGKILSNPKVLTLDNKEAKISTGTEILIPTSTILTAGVTSANLGTATTGVTTINAKLELTVTPHVTPDNQIILHVKTDKKDPDFSRQVQGIPPLSTRTAETDLLVRNGETVVIGGIYTKRESKGENGVPWLSKIPVLGWLFKKQVQVEDQNELLIFITPTIYQGA
jgi:type IV pilus assembly protein PilQ